LSSDAVTLEVFRHLFAAAAEEMGAALRRASYSPNIKERRDYSCAVFDPLGRPVAMGDHMPVHLGAMPMSVTAVLRELGPLEPGDVAMVNDPFHGGTHLPDITLVAPVHAEAAGVAPVHAEAAGELDAGEADEPTLMGFLASRAHHSDVGGMAPGSMPLAREIYQEGVRIPPLLLYRRGVLNSGVMELLLANVRTPGERRGDLDAQLAALHAGQERIRELISSRGIPAVAAAMGDLVAYADRLIASAVEKLPDGSWTAEDALEDDGFGTGPIPIRARVTVRGAQLTVDFTGSAHQVPGGVNAVQAITASATRYVVRCLAEALLGMEIPAGGGSMVGLELILPESSVVNAAPPASVAAGNVETSQRITDVLLRAFGKAVPHLVPALSQGTMNNTTAGGVDPRTGRPFTYYETVGGGMGGGPGGPGLSGVHCHMSNSLNTPVEALEHAYPFRVRAYGLREGSGGSGTHPGGEGLRRDIQLLADATVTILSERRSAGPDGANGGGPGAPGRNVLIRDGREETLPGKVTLELRSGDVVSVRSPGGGGWDPPAGEADPDRASHTPPVDRG
jgi:N-methylhydantoinase B